LIDHADNLNLSSPGWNKYLLCSGFATMDIFVVIYPQFLLAILHDREPLIKIFKVKNPSSAPEQGISTLNMRVDSVTAHRKRHYD